MNNLNKSANRDDGRPLLSSHSRRNGTNTQLPSTASKPNELQTAIITGRAGNVIRRPTLDSSATSSTFGPSTQSGVIDGSSK